MNRLGIPLICLSLAAYAADAPPGLVRLAAERESKTEDVRSKYLYKQVVLFQEIGKSGTRGGEYREQREVIFSPGGERTERMVGKPWNTLALIRLTDEDFRDMREVQPMLLTKESLWLYKAESRGDEIIDTIDCWVISIKPRQILEGQRLFEGLLWVDKSDYSIIRSEGRAMPQIFKRKEENLFPRFTTVRKKVEGGFWFPSVTVSDDVLEFSGGSVRQKMKITYSDYQRFGAESIVKYDAETKPQ